MSTKQKTKPSKENWEAVRWRYTWHLRGAFASEFDRSHWWKSQSKIEPISALYELARRHPLVNERPPLVPPPVGGKASIPLPPIFHPPPLLVWTRRLCRKSWQKLTESERSHWEASIGNWKSFDFRAKESLCRDITSLARQAIYRQREAAYEDFPQLSGLSFLGYLTRPSDQEWEKVIAHYAVEAHRQGYLLFGVAPDLTPKKAGATMKSNYATTYRNTPAQNTLRVKCKAWLQIIAEFEEDEASKSKAKSQVFARYRRVVDAVPFV